MVTDPERLLVRLKQNVASIPRSRDYEHILDSNHACQVLDTSLTPRPPIRNCEDCPLWVVLPNRVRTHEIEQFALA